jgi:hypothetical protein
VLAAVVGPQPRLLPGGRVPAERRVGAERRACRDRPTGKHGQGRALHLVFTVFLTPPVALVLGVPETVGVALGTGDGTEGLTSEAPEIP